MLMRESDLDKELNPSRSLFSKTKPTITTVVEKRIKTRLDGIGYEAVFRDDKLTGISPEAFTTGTIQKAPEAWYEWVTEIYNTLISKQVVERMEGKNTEKSHSHALENENWS